MIDPVTTTPAASTARTDTTDQRKPTALTSDFETFLKMLTAQARYQDPLEPIDSTEYAAQLAQFSMVEQQVLTNDRLKALGDGPGRGGIAELAGWVGMEARAIATARFDGSPVTVQPSPAAGADRAVLVVKDSAGKKVQEMPIPVATGPIEWAGVLPDGSALSNGRYRFEVESYAKDKLIATSQAALYNKVTEVQMDGTAVQLVLASGDVIGATDVTALRSAG